MSTQNSWSAWLVGEPELRQVPGKPVGVQELRCDILCPHCKVSFDVAAASARSNKSQSCRRHLTSGLCAQKDDSGALVPIQHEGTELPPSKRVRTNDALHAGCRVDIESLRQSSEARFREQEELHHDTRERLHSLEVDRDLLLANHKALEVNLITEFPSIQRPITADDIVPKIKMATLVCVPPTSASIVSVGTSPSQAAIVDSVECDRLRAENTALKRKYEISERDRDAAVAQVDRLRSGGELRTYRRIHKVQVEKIQTRDECLVAIDRIVRNVVLPRLSATGACDEVTSLLKGAVGAMKAKDATLLSRQKRAWSGESGSDE